MYSWLIAYHERLIALAAASAWAAPLTALAAVDRVSKNELKIPRNFQSIDTTISTIFNIVITVAGVAFVVLFLLGGIQYLAAAGNEETTKKARQLLLDAVIGLAIVVTAWAAGTYVLRLLGLSRSGQLNLDPDTVGS